VPEPKENLSHSIVPKPGQDDIDNSNEVLPKTDEIKQPDSKKS